ncbi:MAG TPA: thioredoxin domain-containing protein [Thermomicrobiales bacterium]|jgi:protein-disulfide isomerase|nr:thioredoxin domain-containing protein [Thermomicrobiales bacterium]
MIDMSATLTMPVGPRDHTQGPDDAPVTLVEYGDYECPSCGRAYPMIKAVQQQMGDQLRFAYRNFPLREIHPHAQHAAEAAEAAGAQGKFWPMHDTLFEHQQALTDQDLLNYAAGLDLDVDRFAQELEDHTYADRVREDFMSGIRSGVNGTPTFFINGGRYDGSFTADSLVAALIEAAGER